MVESDSQFLVHCSYCGYNFSSDSRASDQECPECEHRASHAEPVSESKHILGEKTNYKGERMDELDENRVP